MSSRVAILGTAGHIDHGKTSLVRRLTGVDTDRLAEEKERGISIELGFAPLTLSDGLRVGVVDVPGHERFIRNMLAGVGGMDLVLLVIAADEGVMPQTREHLDILELLQVPRLIVVLTKRDLVDADTAELAAEEVQEVLKPTRYAGARVLPFSAVTGSGEAELRAALEAEFGQLPSHDLGAPARLPVDRVFVQQGFGTVVTGTLWRGTVRVGDTLIQLPQGRALRVRSVESHGQGVEFVEAGRRVALALHPVAREEIARGDWLVAPGSVEPSRRISARFEHLRSAPRALKARTSVRFHLGAADHPATLRLMGRDELPPGESCLVQLELREPASALRGDRFVVRLESPARTIGGGTVVEGHAMRQRSGDSQGTRRLLRLEEGTPEERLLGELARHRSALTLDQLARAAGVEPAEGESLLQELCSKERVVRVRTEFVDPVLWRTWKELLVSEVQALQQQFPIRFGCSKGEIKSRLQREIPPGLFDALLEECVRAELLHPREDRIALQATIPLPAALVRVAGEVEAEVRRAGLSAPSLAAMATLGGRDGQELVSRLIFEGRVVRIPGDMVVHPEALDAAASTLRERLAGSAGLAMSELKDLFGLSRKYMVPLLEYFDGIGLTRRQGEVRVLRDPA